MSKERVQFVEGESPGGQRGANYTHHQSPLQSHAVRMGGSLEIDHLSRPGSDRFDPRFGFFLG
jgi:hypothetical protein